ncbi:hypothetical protein JAAARDRAFT_192685 [Jaapia argillacea MUCL 33604]|uniref:Uncharacterized protein n=1 Tax=Jaapia argillacea MUCL 33604 TaxID=933084 RepID=A0A067PWE3_9AGAM|nr:hypothetical protein JAAARDRAFT_192685 [Jaapia argillacea MUCL 33604]
MLSVPERHRRGAVDFTAAGVRSDMWHHNKRHQTIPYKLYKSLPIGVKLNISIPFESDIHMGSCPGVSLRELMYERGVKNPYSTPLVGFGFGVIRFRIMWPGYDWDGLWLAEIPTTTLEGPVTRIELGYAVACEYQKFLKAYAMHYPRGDKDYPLHTNRYDVHNLRLVRIFSVENNNFQAEIVHVPEN